MAGDCDFLNDISLKCINRELSESEVKSWSGCEDELATRKKYADYIINQPEFISQLLVILRFQILQGKTFEDIRIKIQDYDLLYIALPLDLPDEQERAIYKFESERLYNLYNIEKDYLSNNISFEDIYMRIFDNFLYDLGNMGVDNFVNSTFIYATARPPTKHEHKNGVRMVTDAPAELFFTKGSTKEDYLKILTSNTNFFENQIKYWHYYLLYSYPPEGTTNKIIKEIKSEFGEINIENIIKYLIIFKA